jgi:selenide,water dikinase
LSVAARRLVLLGGGHAQVQVVKAFLQQPPDNVSVVLINRSRLTPYSGMLPGLIAGHYTHAECHIDLAALCKRADIEFVEREATALDLDAQRVICANGEQYPYDVLSIDTGSTPPLDAVPGARAHALGVKPIERFLLEYDRLLTRYGESSGAVLVIVGGGAAGVEVVLAIDHQLAQRRGDKPRPALALVTDTDRIMNGFCEPARRAAERILAARGIRVHAGAAVRSVGVNKLELANGQWIAATRAIFVTGAAASAMHAGAGLHTDARGFITVSAALQSTSHPNVFATGDIAHVVEHPRPKAGVFAVRQGPPLARNLRRALRNQALEPFQPQTEFLVILSAGGRYAIATRNGMAVEGRWVWRWKDWIDRRFMRQFQ